VNGFNIVYQLFIAMYYSGCQICCNYNPGSHFKMVKAIQGSTRCQFFSLWLNTTCSTH